MSRTKQQKNSDPSGKEGGAPGKDDAVGANDGGMHNEDKSARTKNGATHSRDERVHNHLTVLRAVHRVTRRKFAEELGVHRQTMSYLRRDEYAPSLHLALKIARWFSVPVESVFSLSESPPLT